MAANARRAARAADLVIENAELRDEIARLTAQLKDATPAKPPAKQTK